MFRLQQKVSIDLLSLEAVSESINEQVQVISSDCSLTISMMRKQERSGLLSEATFNKYDLDSELSNVTW